MKNVEQQPTKTEIEKAKELLNSIIKPKLQDAQKRKFIFLLVGRTGVGKSSTVNTLMGQEIAKVGAWEATTVGVEFYDSDAFGVRFTIIDTPGLCDDLAEKGNDEEYLNLIRSKVPEFDCMWFVSRLDETRVTSDEKRGIKLIGEAFGAKVWDHSVILFTWANSVDSAKYPIAVEKRTELIRNEVAKYTDTQTALNVPSIAVDNTSKATPDGQEWLGALYTAVIDRISDRGLLPFCLSTISRVAIPEARTVAGSASLSSSSQGPAINLTQNQVKQVKKRISAAVIPATIALGAGIGSVLGPVGAVAGGCIGAVVGLFAWSDK